MHPLRLFCEVAELRSFSRAAAKHSITQPAVSQRVRQLEQSLGTQLLDRSVRPFALTPAGELLAREGRDLIKRYDDLLSRVADLEPSPSGEVRVDAIYSAGIGDLLAIRDRFADLVPEISVRLDFKRPEEVADAVRRGECDFGILSFPRTWGDVRVQPLREERMVVACHPKHPLVTAGTVRASQLRDVQLVGFEDDLPVGRSIRRYLRANGVEPVFCQVVDNIDTMKSLLRVGANVAILPLPTVAAEVGSEALAALPLEPPLSRPLGIIRSPSHNLSAAAGAFRDYLLAQSDLRHEVSPTSATGVRR